MASPLSVEVIVHAPTVFRHCQHCEVVFQEAGFGRRVHAEQLESALPDDLRHEYAAVWEWAHRLVDTYQDRVAVRVIDVTSPAGIWRALRHRLHRYPAVIVGGREKYVGTDLGSAASLIGRRLDARAG